MALPRFEDEAEAIACLATSRWPKGVRCPHCGSDRIHRMSGRTQAGMYLCNACREKFTVRTGTMMERSHVPLRKWLRAIDLVNEKTASIQELHLELDVSYKTARLLAQRIRRGAKELPAFTTRPVKQAQRGRGRPSYVATPEARRVVEVMYAQGIPRAAIAQTITPPCSVNTLVKAFPEELQRGRAQFKLKIIKSQYLHLLGRPAEYDANGNCVRAAIKPSATMCIYLSKVFLGERTTELNVPEPRPLFTAEMLHCLTEKELGDYIRLTKKMLRGATEQLKLWEAENP